MTQTAQLHPLRMIWPAFMLIAVLMSSLAEAQSAASQKMIEEFRKDYGVQIFFLKRKIDSPWGSGALRASEAKIKDAESYLPILIEEFRLYPPSVLRRTGLKSIVICSELKFGNQARTSIPDWRRRHQRMYYDASVGRHDEAYHRRVIHHEFYHYIDLRDDGKIYSDDDWVKLNRKDFTYGTGGKNMRDGGAGVLSRKHPGFVNRYATSGVEEDKAETFAVMMVHAPLIHEWAKTDPVLAKKMQQMKSLVKKFDPKFNETRWTTIQKLRRHQRTRDILPIVPANPPQNINKDL